MTILLRTLMSIKQTFFFMERMSILSHSCSLLVLLDWIFWPVLLLVRPGIFASSQKCTLTRVWLSLFAILKSFPTTFHSQNYQKCSKKNYTNKQLVSHNYNILDLKFNHIFNSFQKFTMKILTVVPKCGDVQAEFWKKA